MTMSEEAVKQRIRVESATVGIRLLRNNVGACIDQNGRLIRYGLANDSKKMNQDIKSSDLIGITPVVITQAMVGQVVGVFTSVEVKREGWHYTGTGRETAQEKWCALVRALGGKAGFAPSVEDMWKIINSI